jgi:7-dehydrocholesterol reductase
MANRQRLNVRDTDGHTTVWGKSPVCIRAMYRDKNGVQHENILLASGFWGVSRHFHYTGEILGALCWSCTTGFTYLMPFFYVIYLSILLFHRAYRDDVRCSKKYKSYWEDYKHLVPYKIIPGIY